MAARGAASGVLEEIINPNPRALNPERSYIEPWELQTRKLNSRPARGRSFLTSGSEYLLLVGAYRRPYKQSKR